jgi:hypothetical protein
MKADPGIEITRHLSASHGMRSALNAVSRTGGTHG